MKAIRIIAGAVLLTLAPILISAAEPNQPAKKAKGAPIVPLTAPAADAKAAKPAPTVAVPAAKGADDFLTIGFDQLAGFNYDMPDESNVKTNAPATPAKEQIPTEIKSLNTKKVALRGFMLPLKVEGGLITELLIMRDQSMCCYGTVPKINEWVSVKMTSKGVKPIMDQAVTIYGSLKVGEMFENGYLVGIYALDGEKMSGPLDL
jgi:hypothetical protein